MPTQERSNLFVPVVCGCGRNLRAKADQIGTEIRCWDCQQMVLVPMPREHQKVARELSDGVRGVIKGQVLNWVLVCASILTGLLCVPNIGIALAGLFLVLGSSIYGQIIRQASRGGERSTSTWREFLIPGSLAEGLVGLWMAAGTVVPLWSLNAGVHHSPRWSVLGLVIALLTWTLAPLLMFLMFGSDREGRLGWRIGLKLLARHPIATTLALALVPLGLVLLEVGFDLLLSAVGHLPFFALDFMPMPDEPIIFDGIPYYNTVDFRNYPHARFVASYFSGLRHGYSFVGAIPASLSLPTRAGLNGTGLYMNDQWYAALRVFLTLIFQTWMLTMFAIQARWLGLIPLLERRRPA